MKNEAHDHAIERLTDVMRVLATHPGDARQRLVAASTHIWAIHDDEIPSSCRDDWDWILAQMTKFGPEVDDFGRTWRGAIENTMRRIKRRTGSKISKRIYELYWKISSNTEYA